MKYRFRKLEEHKVQVDKDYDRLKKEHEQKSQDLQALYIDIDGVYTLSDQAMEKSKKLDEDLKQLEQTNIQLGSANLQLRQELSDKILALDQAEAARRQLGDRVRVLEDIKVTMEEEAREAEKVRGDMRVNNELKDELIQ